MSDASSGFSSGTLTRFIQNRGRVQLGFFLNSNKPNTEDNDNVIKNRPKEAQTHAIIELDRESVRRWKHRHGAPHPQLDAERATVLLSISQ